MIASLSESDKSAKDEKRWKKQKKKQKKRSFESTDNLEKDEKKGLQRSKTKKRRPFRQKDPGSKADGESDIGLDSGSERINASAPLTDSSSQSLTSPLVEENTKTALCAPSMVINFCELSRHEFRVVCTYASFY